MYGRLKLKGLKTLKVWHLNIEGSFRKKEKLLSQKIDGLDNKSESVALSHQERQEKLQCESDLRRLLAKEEIKMRQRAREKHILEGGQTTKYFHLRAKGRKIRLKIQSLYQEGLVVERETKINKVATDFYKDMFGPSNISHINMDNFSMARPDNNDRSYLIALFPLKRLNLLLIILSTTVPLGQMGSQLSFFKPFGMFLTRTCWLYLGTFTMALG